MLRLFAVGSWLAMVLATAVAAAGDVDPVAPWKTNVKIGPVSKVPGRHTIHSYYVSNPESPDGTRVLYYASTTADGYVGDVCVLDRATGVETVLARNVHCEDAHRAACQQWICNGRRVAFHEVREGQWRVVVVDARTGEQLLTVSDRQLAFGEPTRDLLPIYGRHWNPGPYRNLELLDAETGAIRTSATAAAVQEKYGDWVRKEFGEKPISVFFPVISPDRSRIFFKIASGNGGDNFMSKGASHRQGLVVCDLAGNLIYQRAKWGHPAWHPDSRRIIEMGNILIDTDDGATARIADVPNLRGSHPAVSPDGRLMVTDGLADNIGGTPGQWGVMVGNLQGKTHAVLHTFSQGRGARSWRRSDPHPVFSADSKRIYYNVSEGEFTQLYVAEIR